MTISHPMWFYRPMLSNSTQLKGRHIAMVVRSFSVKGGLELYTHKLVEGLIREGLKITVICEESSTAFRHERLDIATFAAPKPGLPKFKRLQHYYEVASAKIEELGPFDLVHCQHLPVKTVDVVNFHNQTAVQLSRVGLPWERLLNKLKLWIVPAYRLRYEFDDFLFRQSRCRVFSSAVTRDDFQITYGQDPTAAIAPCVVAYPGAALAQQDSSLNGFEKPEPFTFLFVGRGYRKKGLDVLLKSCRLLNRKHLKFQLLIAGLKAKPLDKLRLQFMGLQDKVTYLGFQNDMGKVFAQASAFVMPSRLEPFGMAALQAMQWGAVPIVSRVSGVSEILTPEQDGLILENHLSAQELAFNMERLISDRPFADKLSIQTKVRSQDITWDKTVESVLQAYQLALSGKESGESSNRKTSSNIRSSDGIH